MDSSAVSLVSIILHHVLIFTLWVTPPASSVTSMFLPNRFSFSRANDTSNFLLNEVPRLPTWNNAGTADNRQIDFSQLFELMGEPRGSRGRALSELITRPKPKCNRRIRIFNGVTRIRERGSLARFQCSHGFTLIGPTTIVCLRDRWSEPPPICVKSGCRPLRTPQNGFLRQSVGGAVTAFFCDANAELIGDPVIYCDGVRWNGTEPTCHVEIFTTTTESEPPEPWPVSMMPPLNQDGVHDETSWDTNLKEETERSTTQVENAIPTTISSRNYERQTTLETEISTIMVTPEAEVSHDHLSVTKIPEAVHEQEQHNSTEKNEIVKATESVQPKIVSEATGLRETESITPAEMLPEATTVIPTTSQPQITPLLPAVFTMPPFVIGPPIGINTIENVTSVTETPTTITTIKVTTPAARRTTVRRYRIKTRRPFINRRPTRKPYRRKTTTTKRTTTPKTILTPIINPSSLPIIRPTYFSPPSSTLADSAPSFSNMDYPVAIDKEVLSREQVEPIRPIIMPDMLNINSGDSKEPSESNVSHASMIGGIVLFVIGLSTFSAGVVLYCWRKNKGIARARPYDMDGRTLSAHDANDDFMWVDQRL